MTPRIALLLPAFAGLLLSACAGLPRVDALRARQTPEATASTVPTATATCGPIDLTPHDDSMPVGKAEEVTLSPGETVQIAIERETDAGGGAFIFPSAPDVVTGTYDGVALESIGEAGGFFPRGSLGFLATSRTGTLVLTNGSASTVRVGIVHIEASSRSLRIGTDRVIAGKGDAVCIRIELTDAGENETLSLVAGSEALNPTEIAPGVWTASWKATNPGQQMIRAEVRGPRPRQAQASVEVGSGVLGILPGFAATAVDMDNDRVFDELRIDLSVEAVEAGDYRFVLYVMNSEGGRASGMATVQVGRGVQSVTVPVSGRELEAIANGGPLQVVDVIALHEEGDVGEDMEPVLGKLPEHYRPGQFGPPLPEGMAPPEKPSVANFPATRIAGRPFSWEDTAARCPSVDLDDVYGGGLAVAAGGGILLAGHRTHLRTIGPDCTETPVPLDPRFRIDRLAASPDGQSLFGLYQDRDLHQHVYALALDGTLQLVAGRWCETAGSGAAACPEDAELAAMPAVDVVLSSHVEIAPLDDGTFWVLASLSGRYDDGDVVLRRVMADGTMTAPLPFDTAANGTPALIGADSAGNVFVQTYTQETDIRNRLIVTYRLFRIDTAGGTTELAAPPAQCFAVSASGDLWGYDEAAASLVVLRSTGERQLYPFAPEARAGCSMLRVAPDGTLVMLTVGTTPGLWSIPDPHR